LINEGYPSPSELIKNEIFTLERLKNDIFLAQWKSSLYKDASYAYYQARKLSSFNFESSFEINVDNNPGTAFIGGKVIPSNDGNSYDLLSYYLAICRNEEMKNEPLRKLHFDYTEPDPSHRQPHPIFHFQQPGKLTRAMTEAGCNIDHLYPWLSEPRLPYMPMSLALLINLVFSEFPDEKTTRFIEHTEWRHLIHKNEVLLLYPYYEQCYKFVDNCKKGVIRGLSRLLTNDYYYGN
jgi:hypothetical protein